MFLVLIILAGVALATSILAFTQHVDQRVAPLLLSILAVIMVAMGRGG